MSSVCYNRCHLKKCMFLRKLEMLNFQNFSLKSRVSEDHQSLQCECRLACTQTDTKPESIIYPACLSKRKGKVVKTSDVSDLRSTIYIAANKF